MDKLSDLIQEAKPLYKQRKRRKAVVKMLMTLTLPVLLFGNLIGLYIEGDDLYVSYDKNNIENQLILDEYDILRSNN